MDDSASDTEVPPSCCTSDQPGTYGEDMPWERLFVPGEWHQVEHRIAMDTPGEHESAAVWACGEAVPLLWFVAADARRLVGVEESVS